MNSPETVLFDKGRNLFNLDRARDAVGKGAALILAEGYMDVIALSEAGFGGAVAPLGTAVTEDQLRMLWRVSPEPVVALDGDKAGIRAGLRVVDLALPLLEAGQGLRFAMLPDGQDPDDLIRAKGAPAMQAVLEAAKPMVDLLWAREIEGQVFDSPERRATLDRALRARLAAIRDPSLRAHSAEARRDTRADLFGSRRAASGPPAPRRPWGAQGYGSGWVKGQQPLLPPSQTARASALVADPGAADVLREAVVLATCLVTPALVGEFEPDLERMDCLTPDHALLRDAILRDGAVPDLRDRVASHIGAEVLARLFARPLVAICPTVRHPGDLEKGRMTLAEELAKLRAERGRAAEIAEAEEEIRDASLSDDDERLTRRLREAAATAQKAQRSQSEDRAEYDTAPNGARINRDERAALAQLLSRIAPEKPPG
jgi:DNA primase